MFADMIFGLAMFSIFYGVWLIFRAATRNDSVTGAPTTQPSDIEVQVVMPASIRPSVQRVRRPVHARTIRK